MIGLVWNSREEKRHQEKKNKNQRAQMKKDDNARLRAMLDKTMATDPRIKKFKEEKASRKKSGVGSKGSVAGSKVDQEEEKKRKEEEERKKKEEEEKKAEEEKSKSLEIKKLKETAKKNLKRDKKVISSLIASSNYFVPKGKSPSSKDIENALGELDALMEKIEPEKLSEFRKEAEEAKEGEDLREVIKVWAGKVGGDWKVFV
jgi:DnaJ homolog subfamily C member 2